MLSLSVFSLSLINTVPHRWWVLTGSSFSMYSIFLVLINSKCLPQLVWTSQGIWECVLHLSGPRASHLQTSDNTIPCTGSGGLGIPPRCFPLHFRALNWQISFCEKASVIFQRCFVNLIRLWMAQSCFGSVPVTTEPQDRSLPNPLSPVPGPLAVFQSHSTLPSAEGKIDGLADVT